jgi:hypothetical protein
VAEPELQPEAAEPKPAADVEPDAEAETPVFEPETAEEPASSSGFTPPPTSLEDLAAASRSKRFSFRNQ